MAASAKGLGRGQGSSLDLSSAASSEFEEVRLEELGLAPGEEAESQPAKGADTAFSLFSGSGVVGKTLPAPPPSNRTTVSSSTDSLRLSAARGLSADRSVHSPQQQQAGEGSDASSYDPLKDIETATQKAADIAREAAKEVSFKLFGGATDARSSLTKLAGDVSSWWANFDPSPKQAATGTSSGAQDSSDVSRQASTEAQRRFGLPNTEEVLEDFACTLIQTSQCTHNSYTPSLLTRFPGRLCITSRHACFHAQREDLSFAVQLAASIQVGKVAAPKQVIFKTGSLEQGDLPALRLSLSASDYLLFEAFQPGDLDSALGLVEHVASEAEIHT